MAQAQVKLTLELAKHSTVETVPQSGDRLRISRIYLIE